MNPYISAFHPKHIFGYEFSAAFQTRFRRSLHNKIYKQTAEKYRYEYIAVQKYRTGEIILELSSRFTRHSSTFPGKLQNTSSKYPIDTAIKIITDILKLSFIKAAKIKNGTNSITH